MSYLKERASKQNRDLRTLISWLLPFCGEKYLGVKFKEVRFNFLISSETMKVLVGTKLFIAATHIKAPEFCVCVHKTV